MFVPKKSKCLQRETLPKNNMNLNGRPSPKEEHDLAGKLAPIGRNTWVFLKWTTDLTRETHPQKKTEKTYVVQKQNGFKRETFPEQHQFEEKHFPTQRLPGWVPRCVGSMAYITTWRQFLRVKERSIACSQAFPGLVRILDMWDTTS